MAHNGQEIHQEVENRVEAQAEKLLRGNRLDADRARELLAELNKMNEALRAAQARVNAINLKKPEDVDQARETFKREITEALVALKNTLGGHEQDAIFLVQETRQGLEDIGAFAQKGPEMKPRLWGLLGNVAQIDEWLKAADRDPQSALNDIIGGTQTTIDEIRTAAPTEGIKREGVRTMVADGMNPLARYISGGTTTDQLRRQGSIFQSKNETER